MTVCALSTECRTSSNLFTLCPDVIIFTFYSYVATYFFVIAAFVILRLYEPDTPRWYKVPGGNVGMWLVAGSCFGLMVVFAVWAAVAYMYAAAATWAICNVVFIMLSRNVFD